MTAFAPIATLAASCTLLDTDGLTIATQKLLFDGIAAPGNVVLHHHVVPQGGWYFINVPAEHMLALNLDDSTITRFSVHDDGQSYNIVFKHLQHALAYLAKHYGLTLADPRDPAPADASPCPSVMVLPAQLSTRPRLTRRPLSTTAFSPNGVMHMAKKQPIRVFLDPDTHSRHLIQAGTNGLTSSGLSERLIEYGLAQLENGNKAPLESLSRAASPAPHCNEA